MSACRIIRVSQGVRRLSERRRWGGGLNAAASFQPSLVVLAAGRGSRFRGTKQLEALSDAGNVLIEYSIYDAIRAGFGKVVFVTRRSLHDEFKTVAGRFDDRIDVQYVFQDEFELQKNRPPQRDKPWGTGHAVLVAQDCVSEPFVVINADDYYGANAYTKARGFLEEHDASSTRFAMLGYALEFVLSAHGGVSRGVCRVSDDGRLRGIREYRNVVSDNDVISGERNDTTQKLSGSQLISMNIWMLTPAVFPLLTRDFQVFLARYGDDPDTEFTLSDCLGRLIEAGEISIDCLPHDDDWFGITYREDQALAEELVSRLHRNGTYPWPLWSKDVDP